MTEDQQDQLVISLDTQYAVAHAIYNRFHANGHHQTPHVGKPRRRRPRTMAPDSQGRDHRDAGQPGDRRNGMSHTAIILLALAFPIGWMGGRE